jgi:hypothetical protein
VPGDGRVPLALPLFGVLVLVLVAVLSWSNPYRAAASKRPRFILQRAADMVMLGDGSSAAQYIQTQSPVYLQLLSVRVLVVPVKDLATVLRNRCLMTQMSLFRVF